MKKTIKNSLNIFGGLYLAVAGVSDFLKYVGLAMLIVNLGPIVWQYVVGSKIISRVLGVFKTVAHKAGVVVHASAQALKEDKEVSEKK